MTLECARTASSLSRQSGLARAARSSALVPKATSPLTMAVPSGALQYARSRRAPASLMAGEIRVLFRLRVPVLSLTATEAEVLLISAGVIFAPSCGKLVNHVVGGPSTRDRHAGL